MLIKNMMDDLGDSVGSTEVPIPNVSIRTLFSTFTLDSTGTHFIYTGE